jgi:hypothetical protein
MELDRFSFVLLRRGARANELFEEEARRLAESDPSVRAGHMAVQVFNRWTKKGTVRFEF